MLDKDGWAVVEYNAGMRRKREPQSAPEKLSRLRLILFSVLALMLVLVPLAISSDVYRTTVLPKYVILLVGSSVVLMLVVMMIASGERYWARLATLRSPITILVGLFLIVIGVSTAFGVAPLGSLLGSYDSEMGLLSYICFFACFIGIMVAVVSSERLLVTMLRAISYTVLVVAAYAVAQFVGRDPFLSPALYTYQTASGPVVRVPSTLGNSNYLGNFLLYTSPISAALAFISKGSARRIAIVSVALSLAAIAFSGTRGAWLGALGSGVAFVLLLGPHKAGAFRKAFQQRSRAAVIGTAALLVVSVLIIAASPRSRSIVLRGQAFFTDGLTGSGRTILWRDAIGMIPRYAMFGCGPEGFSKAFLPYKSQELAKNAPQINNESSHNTYIDSAISYGLAGAVIYIAIVVYAFKLVLRSRRTAVNERIKFISIGLTCALIGTGIHNIFIYNQIPTGLYFFSFLALIAAVSNIAANSGPAGERQDADTFANSVALRKVAVVLSALVGLTIIIGAVYYSLAIARADAALKDAFDFARAGSIEQVISSGERVTSVPDPIHAYDYQVARALTQVIDISDRASPETGRTPTEQAALRARRLKTIDIALSHAEWSLPCSLTPEASAVIAAYLAFKSGDTERLRSCAERAIKLDPRLFSARWLMAEALLGSNDAEGAIREARMALAIDPSSAEAHSVMKRARGEFDDLLKRATKAERKGKLNRAETLLVRAAHDFDSCISCHRALALFWERRAKWTDAANEWKRLLSIADAASLKEEAEAHLKTASEMSLRGL